METNDVLNHLKNCVEVLDLVVQKMQGKDLESDQKILSDYVLSLADSLSTFGSFYLKRTVRFYTDGTVWSYSPSKGKTEKDFDDLLENLSVMSIGDFIKSLPKETLNGFNRTFEVLCRHQAMSEISNSDVKPNNGKGVFNA